MDAACNTVMGEAARQPTTCLARHLDAEVSPSQLALVERFFGLFVVWRHQGSVDRAAPSAITRRAGFVSQFGHGTVIRLFTVRRDVGR